MAPGAKQTVDSASEPTTAVTLEAPTGTIRPIVFETKKKKGRKKKYSRGLKDVQKVEVGLSRSAERLAEAVADGLGRYRKRRDRSAGKKRDGAVRDAIRNIGRGAEKGLRSASKAPSDLADELSAKRITRLVTPLSLLRR